MKYQQKPLVIPKLEITSEERKPFTFLTYFYKLKDKFKFEIKFTWRF